MNETSNSQVCERSEDLISFLYGELSEREAHSFEQHRRSCTACNGEIKAFGPVRQSIRAWRDHSLGVAASDSFTTNAIHAFQPEGNRSALAAIRGFFALSPMWMKGATAVATVLFCILVGLTIARLLGNGQPQGVYNLSSDVQAGTERRIEEEVKRRLEAEIAAVNARNADSVASKPEQPPKQKRIAPAIVEQRDLSIPASQKMRKPLTRAEREQLAADLRLVLDEDDDSLQLLGDRINR